MRSGLSLVPGTTVIHTLKLGLTASKVGSLLWTSRNKTVRLHSWKGLTHLHHDDVCAKFKIKSNKDWYHQSQHAIVREYLGRGCTEKRIVCPAGSLVLWDSRTLHYGGSPLPTRTQDHFRLAVYVCYLPRSLANSKCITKRRKYFENLKGTYHHPLTVTPVPRIRTELLPRPPMAEIPAPVLTPLGLRLVGY